MLYQIMGAGTHGPVEYDLTISPYYKKGSNLSIISYILT